MISIRTIAKLLILLVVVTLGSTLHIAQADAPLMTQKQQEDARLYAWVDKLEIAESNGNASLHFLDVNHQYSNGCLQFQDGTWETYSKEYGIQGTPYECDKARQLAVDMIENHYNLWRSWWTSVMQKGVGLPPKES